MAEYLVRLAVTVDANTPADAVEEFIQSVVASGLRHWVYAVDDADGEEHFGYFDGEGNEIDVEKAIREADSDVETTPEDGVEDLNLPEGDGEDELLAFAQTLAKPQGE